MLMEFVLIGGIVIFLLIYHNVINAKDVLNNNTGLLDVFKESDYEFYLLAKYGDKVYDAEEVYINRVKKSLVVMLGMFGVYLLNQTMVFFVLIFVVGILYFKYQYMTLKSWYRKHLIEVDSMLPYFLKGLEVLIQHYTVPVAIAKSIDDAPAVFRSGLKQLCAEIEAGDSSIDPYMRFAQLYPVRDSMRMMRLLYRLGLGEQEKKQEQLVAFSKSVSSLQQKAREAKYKARLDAMERKTMLMLCVTGFGSMALLLVAIFFMLANNL